MWAKLAWVCRGRRWLNAVLPGTVVQEAWVSDFFPCFGAAPCVRPRTVLECPVETVTVFTDRAGNDGMTHPHLTSLLMWSARRLLHRRNYFPFFSFN